MTDALARFPVRRRWRLYSGRKARGIAEIVGTLMLILIVIAAAVALAAFVASYQKQLQAEQNQANQQKLEDLKILSITPVLNASNSSRWSSFSFVLASEYINPSIIDSISLNGQPLQAYWVVDLSNPTATPVAYSSNTTDLLTLAPRQQVVVEVNLTIAPGGAFDSIYNPSFVLTTTDYIEVSVYTQLQNTFTEVFVPPTAVAVVSSLSTFSGGYYQTIPILDGSNSFATDNGTVVGWNWNVTNSTELPSTSASISNPSVSQSASPEAETGVATFDEPAGFLVGEGISLNVTYTPATGSGGSGSITPGSLVISQQSSTAPGVVTVDYSFSYTVSGSGDYGSISIAPVGGAGLSYSTDLPWGSLASTSATVSASPVVVGPNLETGTATFDLPSGSDPTPFVSGTEIALTFASGTGYATGQVTTGPTITSEAPGPGNTEVVNYKFTYTAAVAGNLVVADGGTGATLTYTTQYTYTASGEEIEPSYWLDAPIGSVFTITLTVVNTDDLFGVTQIQYTNP